jgi:hypothetical protein
MKKRTFVPSFLQKIDDYLLRYKPATWAARTHLVLWFAALFALALTVCCYASFYDAKEHHSLDGWLGIIGLIFFIGFVFWLIFLLRFNVFKRYGNWCAWDGLKQFLLYFVSIGSMGAILMIPSAVQTFRANQQFTANEIVSDVNEINMMACQLEYGLLPTHWEQDTFQVVEKLNEELREEVETDTTALPVEYFDSYKYRYVDTSQFNGMLESADSTVKLNDSVYFFYRCPSLLFVEPRYLSDSVSKKLLRSLDIYYALLNTGQRIDRGALLNRIRELQLKYSARNRYENYYDENDNPNGNYHDKIKKKYRLNSVNDGVGYLCARKYEWERNGTIYGRVFFYTSFALSLLVFVFRHSTIKTFFLSILTAAVIIILTGFLVAISNGRAKALLSFNLLYYLMFAIFAMAISGSHVRKAVQGIALNLFFLLTPFVPITILGLYISIEDDYYYQRRYPADYINPEVYIPAAEVAGVIIFLILLEPLFRKLYRKWYAAPEN